MSAESINPITDNPVGLTMPFAGEETAVATEFPKSQPIGVGVRANFADGFPSAYSSPGKYVSRGDMNGIGRISTANAARAKQGGINTYNAKFVEMLKNDSGVGGYAKDAILDWWDERNQLFQKVISLKNNNDYDFTQRGSDGYSVGPDGVNWKLCSGNGMWIPDYSNGTGLINSTGVVSLSLPTSMGYVSSQFTMPYDGFVSINVDGTYQIPCSLFTGIDIQNCYFKFVRASIVPGFVVFTFYKKVTDKFYGLITGDVYDKCRHSLYLALSEDGDVSVDMDNLIDGNSENTVIHVSSSGTEGGGGSGLIPVRKGTRMRLVGFQTYTQAIADSSLYVEGTIIQKYYSQVLSDNNLKTTGSIGLTARITAFPAMGPTSEESED